MLDEMLDPGAPKRASDPSRFCRRARERAHYWACDLCELARPGTVVPYGVSGRERDQPRLTLAMERLPGELSSLCAVGGRRVRIVDGGSGDGPPVFFDAALGTPLEEWALVAPPVAARQDVTLWDRPGIGESDDGATVTGPALVALVAEVLRRRPSPSVLVGHSLGALHMLCVALEHPELVCGLVLVEPSHPGQTNRLGASQDPALLIANAASALPQPVRGALGSFIAFAGSLLPLDRRTRAMTDLAPLVARRLRAVNQEHASMEAMFAYATELLQDKTLGDLPTEVLTGAHNFSNDAALRAEWRAMHDELAALSSRGSRHLVECDDHGVPFADPAAVIEAVERVAVAVSGVRRGGSRSPRASGDASSPDSRRGW